MNWLVIACWSAEIFISDTCLIKPAIHAHALQTVRKMSGHTNDESRSSSHSLFLDFALQNVLLSLPYTIDHQHTSQIQISMPDNSGLCDQSNLR